MTMLQEQLKTLQSSLNNPRENVPTPMASFQPFDSTSELWTDYLARFRTFVTANSVPDNKQAQIFLTNQSNSVYKMLSNLAAQQQPVKSIHELTMNDIQTFMAEQFDPKRFVVRERFKFWSDMKRKPGETIPELASRIRQDAATCDFQSIKDPLDEALRTKFICSVDNEAVLKTLFKLKDDELKFSNAIRVAQEVEEAAKVAKETVHGQPSTSVQKVYHAKSKTSKTQEKKTACFRCGNSGHFSKACPHIKAICSFCKKTGHLQSVCMSRLRDNSKLVKQQMKLVHKVQCSVSPIYQTIRLNDHRIKFEIDSGASDTFCCEATWQTLGKPTLQPVTVQYQVAEGSPLPVVGQFQSTATIDGKSPDVTFPVIVTKVPNLNLLGRLAMMKLKLTNLTDHFRENLSCAESTATIEHVTTTGPENSLDAACIQLCGEFPTLFESTLGCLKDFSLDIRFKPEAKPIFKKPRPVPFSILQDLNEAYEAGIKRGVWELTDFNSYGTPVVPIRKSPLPGQAKASIRVCGDYSVTVNSQLEDHRQPIPLPEDLMRKLGRGYCFSKIDLANAYNQICLSPDSQKKLALSTHKGVLLQKRLPFGIKSAPGYFQEIMEQLTQNLRGVAVYFDDILVSGDNAKDHLMNLRALFKRLEEKGLRCNREKCVFAQVSIDYLGHTLSSRGIAKGSKVDAILEMPTPKNISTLKSFLASVQFYSKFLPPYFSEITEPLYKLTRKGQQWKWGEEEATSFKEIKRLLCTETILAHYDPSLPLGLSCDASECGIGAVLFHRFADGSERPILNISKVLSATQRRYSQIQKEALSLVYALKKFHQFLYGRKFIVVTDHKPLVTLFAPDKGTPAMAANRLARWALLIHQYDYTVEYRRSKDHGNADALSRLPFSNDTSFDGEEMEDDVDSVCLVRTISRQINPDNPLLVVRETAKDPILFQLMRFVKEGWPHAFSEELKDFKKLENSLSTENGCVFYGLRVIIPSTLRNHILKLLHLGHFGMQRMKQLARSTVYWPRIDFDIENLCRKCTSCGQFQNKPDKPSIHPWMMPEKPWSRLHLDHAINFLGRNWLVLVDAYSKYPCIHTTTSTSSKSTTAILEQEFAHFGYPHTLVTDNATTFMSQEFQAWCKQRGIVHLTGAPYHPATNGAAERLIQSFKQALRKSSLPPKEALQEFLMQYRRIPFASGLSPSELLNGRRIRTKIDTLVPSIPHLLQGRQSRQASKHSNTEDSEVVSKVEHHYTLGDPCYALYFGPRRDRDPRWVPAIVTKVHGTRSVNVRVIPRGPTWRRHLDQLRPRYGSDQDDDPCEIPTSVLSTETLPAGTDHASSSSSMNQRNNPRLPTGDEYGRHNLRRSARAKRPPKKYCC